MPRNQKKDKRNSKRQLNSDLDESELRINKERSDLKQKDEGKSKRCVMKMNSRNNLLQVEEADIDQGELKINKEGCDLKQKDEGKSEYCMRRMISKDNLL